MPRTVAIIPARGGSKGIPGKNVRLFCGRPLLSYSVEAGLGAEPVDEVYVSTDDSIIASVAKECGAQVIDRPAEFATDTASTFSVLKHASEVLSGPDVLVTLQPTSPLRTSTHIEEAVRLLEEDVDTVVAVCPTHRYHWRMKQGYGVSEFENRRRRQDMQSQYIENGSIYVSRKSVFLDDDDKLGMGISSRGKTRLYVMEDVHSIELDSETDFVALEEVFKQKKGVEFAMSKFKIADKWVGEGEPAFIIAEIGNNHNGDYEMAIKLIDAAIACGADAIKFQVKDIETAFPKELLDSPYGGPHSFGRTYREHKQALELTYDQYGESKEYSEKKGMIWFATPFDLKSLEFLKTLDVPTYKIASFHLTNNELLRAACRTAKPLILSTGMSELDETDHAVAILRDEGAEFAVLQCTSSYPTDDKDVNLAVIAEYKKRYQCVVGYSGHDRGITIPAASTCFGGKIIEKHFTLDRTLRGPDHAASLELKGLAGLVERTRLIETAIGSPHKRVLECELANRKKNRGY